MNPKLENLKLLGIFGIVQEATKLIYQCRKIFTQITLAFILPLNLLSIATFLFFLPKAKPSNVFSSQMGYHHLIFNIVFSIFSIVYSLFSTATVIYTVACVYTARDISFKRVINIVPKVWKRLLVTILCVSLAFFALSCISLSVIFLIPLMVSEKIRQNPNSLTFALGSLVFISMFMIFFFVGNLYLAIIWEVSNVVSVLEELCGFKAMAKSKALVKGKMGMITKLWMLLILPFGAILAVFYGLVIQSPSVGVVAKCILGIIWALLSSMFNLFLLVARTLIYLVCKLYHHEIVDKFSLSDHLQSYALPEYVLLKIDDHVQIEKLQIKHVEVEDSNLYTK